MDHYLWVEKFRPASIEECILPERLKKFFQAQVDAGSLQNMLLLGGPGTGKTTAAKAMCNEMGIDVLFINASEQGGIDTLRTLVRGYASTVSFIDGSHRCIILDEADYLSPAAQPALRGMIEEFASNCRFILTANFGNRIIDPIKSRCAVIDFALKKDEKMECIMGFNRRVKTILGDENIVFSPKDVASIIQQYFPDYRKILNELQRNSHGGELRVSQLSAISEDAVKTVIEFIKTAKFAEIRKWVINNADIDFHALCKMIFDMALPQIQSNTIPDFVMILADYDYKRAFIVNPEIHTIALLCEIMIRCEWK